MRSDPEFNGGRRNPDGPGAVRRGRGAGFRARWPGIELEIIGEIRQADLYRREADLALRMARPEQAGLAARPLAQTGYGLYAAPGWFERPAREWKLIGYGEAMKDTPQQAWLDKFIAGRPYAFRTNDAIALLAAVLQEHAAMLA